MAHAKNQGEGDREAARRFNDSSEKFVKSEKGRDSAKKSDHSGKNSAEELKKAEQEAAARAKENDEEALRDYSKPAKK